MTLELLAPAGNLEKLKIAILYGADAVYVAGQSFSLRRAANNFNLEEIRSAIEFAHQHRSRLYITVNAFLHDSEAVDLIDYLAELEDLQPDALICSDLGVVRLAREHTGIPIHVSTQASVLNSQHAEIWKEFGAKRIVVGRELTIEEAASIKKTTGLEVEMFIHGAMCMAFSGHCSMSTFVANRDSNRGGCIQNCRFKYTLFTNDKPVKKSHLLSSKDLCGIELIKEFLNHGIDSVKIEGRMKSNLYIASTVRAYANAISGGSDDAGIWFDELKKLPYRGYTTGSLFERAGSESVYGLSKEIDQEYKLAGTVMDIDEAGSRFAFQVRNRFKAGDRIEVMSFNGDLIDIKINEIRNIDNHIIPIAQPGNLIWLPLKKGIEINNVARILRN